MSEQPAEEALTVDVEKDDDFNKDDDGELTWHSSHLYQVDKLNLILSLELRGFWWMWIPSPPPKHRFSYELKILNKMLFKLKVILPDDSCVLGE
jgi:hypothetical protein